VGSGQEGDAGDPDLPPIIVSDALMAQARAGLPELPAARRKRYVARGLSPADARTLVAERGLCEAFEATLALRDAPKPIANWMLNDVSAALRARGLAPEQMAQLITPRALAALVGLVEDGVISGKSGKDVLAEIASGRGDDPAAIVDANGWRKQVDSGALQAAVSAVIAENPEQVDKIRQGKGKVLGFLVGQVMKKGGGAFDPKDVSVALTAALGIDKPTDG
jgi:aspartyl-tRNA(Asn)/glutamyl-tRNA(Gln) amidotransferase subunit B